MTTIENLYFGNIHPWEKEVQPGSTTAQRIEQLVRTEQELDSSLSEEQSLLFTRYKALQLELSSQVECDNYAEGFRTGARLMMDILSDNP